MVDVAATLERINTPALICIDAGVFFVMDRIFRERGLWRSTYVEEYHDGGYVPVSDENWTVIETVIEKYLSEGSMTTCNDLVSALAALAGAALNSNCGCCDDQSSGGYGAGENEEAPTEQVDNGEDIPGPGWEDYGTYDDYKCRVATWIVSRVDDSLDEASNQINWSALSATLEIAAALSLALAIEVPFSIIITVASALALTAALGIKAFIEDLISTYETFNDDYGCALYNAPNVAAAKAAWQAVTEEALVGYSDVATIVGRSILNMFANNDAFNRLFELDQSNPFDEVADCTGCGAPAWVIGAGTLVSGTLEGDDLNDLVIASVHSATGGPSCPREQVNLYLPADGENRDITVTASAGYIAQQCNNPPCGYSSVLYTNSAGGITCVQWADFNGQPICIGTAGLVAIYSQSGATFEMIVDRSAGVC